MMQDNYRIYQQGLALILAALVVVGGSIVLLTMAIERAPAVAAVAFVAIILILGAGALMYRRDQHRMMAFVENVVAQKGTGGVIDVPPAFAPASPASPALPAPRKTVPFVAARSPVVSLMSRDGQAVDVTEKSLRRFLGMETPRRDEWQGDNNDFAAIAANFMQRGFLTTNGKSYEWANGGRGQLHAQSCVNAWCAETGSNQTW